MDKQSKHAYTSDMGKLETNRVKNRYPHILPCKQITSLHFVSLLLLRLVYSFSVPVYLPHCVIVKVLFHTLIPIYARCEGYDFYSIE